MIRLGFIHCIYRLDKTDILVLFCLVVSIRNLLAQCQGSNNFCSHLLEFLCKTGYAATRSDDVVEEENFLARKNDSSMWSVSTSSPSSSAVDEKLKAG